METDKPSSADKRSARMSVKRIVPLVICAAVFVFCAVKLIAYFADIIGAKSSTASLRSIYAESSDAPTASPSPTAALAAATESPSAAPQAVAAVPTAEPSADELWPQYYPNNRRLTISSRFLDLLEENSDIVGWLTIDGIVDEPVMQRDNEYYLTHDAKRRKSVTGALFMEEGCNLRNADTQLVIHGHNMKEGAMFGSLKKYKVKDASFYKAHPFLTFNTIYEDAQYVIFAVLEADVRPGEHNYLPFWITQRFTSAEDFDAYINQARNLSHYRCDVDVEAGDRLVTLATCLGDDENKRLLIMARMLRKDEDMLALRMRIATSGDK